ncbi:hypothetical protein O4H49_03060 [Kiloniella laminariae]|uniref:Baseplate protein J-like domain-containing protein n=1 Tax=Kiloniella laminariae TaxID=454162 RepID=A0ABT4LF63_9PROT|nr:hypothetical protein [Kiloniella laminariae]MCZ4279743.1 hypothetical protein [Kiloniella laminariae]
MADPTATPVLDTPVLGPASSSLPKWARDIINSQFKRLFGRSYSIDKAIELLTAISTLAEVDDKDIVEIGVMYAYYLEHHQKSQMAAELLRLYLNQTQPALAAPGSFTFDALARRAIISETTIRNLPNFDGLVCANATVILEGAIQKRLDNPTALHPAKGASLTRPDGGIETITPAISPLHSGGSETIFFDFNILLPSDEKLPIKQALGTITVVAKVTVTSTPSPPDPADPLNRWQVTVDSWEHWGYDEGDFEWNELSKDPDDKKTQTVGISFDELLPGWVPGKKRLMKEINKTFPELQGLLENFQIKDKYMHQIENKIITLPDGTAFHPQTYEIYIEAWSLDPATGRCPVKSEYSN